MVERPLTSSAAGVDKNKFEATMGQFMTVPERVAPRKPVRRYCRLCDEPLFYLEVKAVPNTAFPTSTKRVINSASQPISVALPNSDRDLVISPTKKLTFGAIDIRICAHAPIEDMKEAGRQQWRTTGM